jgi:PAS domain S-box-containing protein
MTSKPGPGRKPSAKNVTERKWTEDSLRESNELYRTLFDNTSDGFVLVEPVFDETGNSDDYYMLEINDAWEQQTGLRAADLVGKRIREALPDVEHVWPATFARVARTGNARHFESYNADSGRWYDLHAFPYRNGQVGVLFRDITDRKRAAKVQRESEERFRAFVTASSDVVYRMSPDWTEMRQLQGREFIPDTDRPSDSWLDRYILPDDQPRVLDAICHAIRTKSIFELEHRVSSRWTAQ